MVLSYESYRLINGINCFDASNNQLLGGLTVNEKNSIEIIIRKRNAIRFKYG